MSITTVRLQPEIEQGLHEMAGATHRSKSWLINQAVKEYIARQAQDDIRWQETLQAMESVSQGKVLSGESVHQLLNSWGTPDELLSPIDSSKVDS